MVGHRLAVEIHGCHSDRQKVTSLSCTHTPSQPPTNSTKRVICVVPTLIKTCLTSDCARPCAFRSCLTFYGEVVTFEGIFPPCVMAKGHLTRM